MPRPRLSNVTVDDGEEARCAGCDTELCVGLRAPTGTTSMLTRHSTATSPCTRDTAGQVVSARCNEKRVVPGAGFKERAREVDELVCSAAGVLKASEQPYGFPGEQGGTGSMPGNCRGVLEGGSLLEGCPRGRSPSPSATGNDKLDLTRAFYASSHNQTPRNDSWSLDMRDPDACGYSYRQEGRAKFTQEFLKNREAVLQRGRLSLMSGIQCWMWAFLLLWNTHVLHAQAQHSSAQLSALCSLLSALRSPLSALRSLLSALRSQLSALRSLLSVLSARVQYWMQT
ncbi:hypothetical protein ACEWY4_017698 [Coilia grayii]|uniref:Uncharacterized protein n=1 Tax=Coilia grayii TaxID=363190 RepID=A0ABD1JHT9_9TELE